MSYYIAPQSELGEMLFTELLKRLSDFKPEDGCKCIQIQKGDEGIPMYVPTYPPGVNGSCGSARTEFVLRF